MIIYRGPSLIDNKPIVAIAVFPKKKANAKTGAMVQTYILADNGFDPMHNNKTGGILAFVAIAHIREPQQTTQIRSLQPIELVMSI